MGTNLSHKKASHLPELRTQSERQNLSQKKISTQFSVLTMCVFPLTNPSSIHSLPCHTEQEFCLAKTGPITVRKNVFKYKLFTFSYNCNLFSPSVTALKLLVTSWHPQPGKYFGPCYSPSFWHRSYKQRTQSDTCKYVKQCVLTNPKPHPSALK